MAPTRAKNASKSKDLNEENGTAEKPVRNSRAVKAASYKDLSDSEEDVPKKRKQDSDSEEEEEEKPKKKTHAKKSKKGPARKKKPETESEDEENSDYESYEDERPVRNKNKNKPVRASRAAKGTSYKELSNSEEDSMDDDYFEEEDKPKKKPSTGTGRRGRPPKKMPAAAADSGEESAKAEKDDDEKSNESGEEASKSEQKQSAKKSDEDSESGGENERKDPPKKADYELSGEEDVSEEEKYTPKKRGPVRKGSEDAETDEKPAKRAKLEEKPKTNKTDSDYSTMDFSCDKKTVNGEAWNLKISSWNVAGLKAWVKKNGLEFIEYEKPDILCLQETKCSEKKLPPEAKVKGYHTYWLSGEKEGYAGVALLSKEKPLNVEYGVGKEDYDNDGRVITAEFEKFYLVNVYVPNAGQGLKTLPRRMEWDPLFRAHLKKLDEKKPVILCGDLNVAHTEIDLANPKTNTKSAGFTPEEREGMSTLLQEGFVDSFRHLYPDKTGAYSFWTYLGNARSRNTGWRLDYFILSQRFLPNLVDSVMRSEVYGSDHCPITLFAHV